jgi:hypothetical protein
MKLWHLFLLSPLFILAGCVSSTNGQLSSCNADLLSPYLTFNTKNREWQPTKVECVSKTDTTYNNLPYTFNTATESLKQHYLSIDSGPGNANIKKYIKALVTADLVYALFSYQFLGPEVGMAETVNSSVNLLPLPVLYNIGNNNQFPFYCEERSVYYLRIVDSLLHLKGRIASIEKTHVYPVIYIGSDSVIIDPYDPFVLIDTSTNKIVAWPDFDKPQLNTHIVPVRTKRAYGNTHLLISKKFANHIQTLYAHNLTDNICILLEKYFIDNQHKLLAYKRSCVSLPDQPLYNTLKIAGNNNNNAYTIEMTGRPDGQLNNYNDLLKYYTRTTCR